MAFWSRFFGGTGNTMERMSLDSHGIDKTEVVAYRLRSLLDKVIDCRQTYSSTSNPTLERRMAEEFRQLVERIDRLLSQITSNRDIEVIIDTFISSLSSEINGREQPTRIEGRVIWVEGESCRGIQRVITTNLSRFEKVWLKALRTRLREYAAKLIRQGGSAANRDFECCVNFFLLTNTDTAREALEKELERFPSDELNRSLDPFSKIRNALSKGSRQLSGCWDDHWEETP